MKGRFCGMLLINLYCDLFYLTEVWLWRIYSITSPLQGSKCIISIKLNPVGYRLVRISFLSKFVSSGKIVKWGGGGGSTYSYIHVLHH